MLARSEGILGDCQTWMDKGKRASLEGKLGTPGRFLCSRKAAHQKGAKEADGHLVLRRWANRMTLSLLGSANLFRPGLRLNGPSNTASRHRLHDRSDRAMHPSHVAIVDHPPPYKGE